jgi:hypothetical protein
MNPRVARNAKLLMLTAMAFLLWGQAARAQTYAITGYVRDGGGVLNGVTVTLYSGSGTTGADLGSTVTGMNCPKGQYNFSMQNLTQGNSITLQFSKAGYTTCCYTMTVPAPPTINVPTVVITLGTSSGCPTCRLYGLGLESAMRIESLASEPEIRTPVAACSPPADACWSSAPRCHSRCRLGLFRR